VSKPVDPRGHVERPGHPIPARVGCWECEDTRGKGQPWARTCEAHLRSLGYADATDEQRAAAGFELDMNLALRKASG
jgi:hypothetical protein